VSVKGYKDYSREAHGLLGAAYRCDAATNHHHHDSSDEYVSARFGKRETCCGAAAVGQPNGSSENEPPVCTMKTRLVRVDFYTMYHVVHRQNADDSERKEQTLGRNARETLFEHTQLKKCRTKALFNSSLSMLHYFGQPRAVGKKESSGTTLFLFPR
jgi:hypothetical protein